MSATFVYFILPAILLILGLPIFVVLTLTSTAAIVFVAHVPLDAIQTNMFGSLDNFPLLAVPFFVLAGEIMGRGGIANRVVNWVVSLIGGVRGSLAVTTVASSELFGAMAHTTVGTVVAIGRLLFPSLTKHGYSRALRGQPDYLVRRGRRDHSAVDLDDPLRHDGAGVGDPAVHRRHPAQPADRRCRCRLCALSTRTIKAVPLTSRTRWKNIWASTKEASWAIGTIVVIFGGIYGGVFTPTEAAGVAVVYSLFVAMFIYREIGLAELWQVIVSSVYLIAQILIIVTGAGIYSWLMTTSGIPQNLIGAIDAMHLPAWQTLLFVNAGLLLAGSFLEPPAAILILTPLLLARGASRRHQRHPLRHHHGGQFEHRPLHAAVRAEPVCRARHLQRADGDDLPRRAAVRGDQFCHAVAHHLRAGDFDGSARDLPLAPRSA